MMRRRNWGSRHQPGLRWRFGKRKDIPGDAGVLLVDVEVVVAGDVLLQEQDAPLLQTCLAASPAGHQVSCDSNWGGGGFV